MFSDSNHRQFQKGLDSHKLRANRYKDTLSLRKKNREAHLQKRRRELSKSSKVPSFYSNLNNNNNNVSQISAINPQNSDISVCVECLMNPNDNNDPRKQLSAVTTLRLLTSKEGTPPLNEIISSGVIPTIISFMNLNNSNNINSFDPDNALQFESAWIITNVASSSSEYVYKLAEWGAIEAFLNLLQTSSNQDIIEQSIWGLSNISGDNITLRNRVLQTNLLQFLVSNFFLWKIETQRNAIWTISNLCRHGIQNHNQCRNVVDVVTPLLSKILKEITDPGILKDSFWCLVYFANFVDEEYTANAQIKNNIVSLTLNVLKNEKNKFEYAYLQEQKKLRRRTGNGNGNYKKNIHTAALSAMDFGILSPLIRVIGSIVAGDDNQCQMVLDNGYCDMIEPFMKHSESVMRKTVFWTLSNILAGNQQQIEYILSRPNLVETIIGAVYRDTSVVKKEALHCICNATADAVTEQKKLLVDAGAIEALCYLLNSPDILIKEDNIKIILEAFESLLNTYKSSQCNPYADQVEECSGLEYLEKISADETISQDLYDTILNFIKTFYGFQNQINIQNDNQNDNYNSLHANTNSKTNQFNFGYNGNKENQNKNNKNNGGNTGGNNKYQF